MSKFKVGDRVQLIGMWGQVMPNDKGVILKYSSIEYPNVRFDNYEYISDRDFHSVNSQHLKLVNSELVKEKLGLQKAKK